MNVPEMTVASIVNQHPGSAIVFKKYNIDFCCNGKIPLEEACEKASVNTQKILDEISELNRQPGTLTRFNQWSVGLIIDYIVENHHAYLNKTLPQLMPLAEKVAMVHGDNHPELIELYHVLNELKNELQAHTRKEEIQLFPLIKQLAKQEGIVLEEHSYMQLLDELESEHENAGAALAQLNRLTKGYSPPVDACSSYNVLFQLLAELEDDTHQHVHVENNVLFPKVKAMLHF